MKRKVLHFFYVTILLFAGLSQAKSQGYYNINFTNGPGNPGGLNKDVDYPKSTGWTTIVNPTDTPKYSPTQTIPFTFQFNGNTVTSYKAASTGYITFDVTAIKAATGVNETLPSALLPNNTVCAWGLGLKINDKANNIASVIQTKVYGVAPKRQLWIQFYAANSPEDAQAMGFWSIVLEEGTNNIYVVDQLTLFYNSDPNPTPPAVTVGVQISQTQYLSATGSPDIKNSASGYGSVDDNNYYAFFPGTQPSYDLSLNSVVVNPWYAVGKNIPVTGDFYNFGSQTITSADLNYSVDGGSVVTQSLTSLNLAPGDLYTFTHATPYVPTSSGNKVLKVWLSAPNGQTDANHKNDTLKQNLNCIDSLFEKKALVEEFTNASCDPCAAAMPNLDKVLKAVAANQNTIRYHVSWPARDVMYVANSAEVDARVKYYGVNGVPDAKVDGIQDVSPATLKATDITDRASIGTPFKVTGSSAYDQATKTFTLNAEITSYISYPAGFKAYAVLTMDKLYFKKNQSLETRPQYTFLDAMEQMLPDVNGKTLPAIVAGQAQTFSVSWTKDRPWALDRDFRYPAAPEPFTYDSSWVRFIVFVQNPTTKEVYQSFASIPTGAPASGVSELRNFQFLEMYPNPANTQTTVGFGLKSAENVKISVYNLLGKKMFAEDKGLLTAGVHEAQVNVAEWPNGIYMMTVNTGSGTLTRKLIVNK